MAIRDKIAANVQPRLEPGETFQSGFAVQGGMNPLLVPLTGFLGMFFLAKYYIVAVTDRRIALFKATPFGTTKPKELVGSFPRETTFGPVSGIWGKITLGGKRYYVHKRYHKDVAKIDATPAAA